jgi:hypothetical protein
MSDNNPSGNLDSASGASKDGQDQKQVSYDSYSKVLGEKKKIQSDMEGMRTKLAEYEQAKLEAEGNLKQALENQKKLTLDSQNQLKEVFSHVTNKVLKQKVYSEAEKIGCVDPETLYKILDFEGVEFTKEFDLVNETVLSNKIQELAKNKPFMFKKDVKMPNDLTPGNQGNVIPQKPISKMSAAEQRALLIQANASGQ